MMGGLEMVFGGSWPTDLRSLLCEIKKTYGFRSAGIIQKLRKERDNLQEDKQWRKMQLGKDI